MRRLYFTVDADRDANIPIPGQEAAGSTDRGSGTAPRFSSTGRGMGVLAELLDSLGVKGTFFIEGRTAEVVDCAVLGGHAIGLHGYDHEDLTGASTGVLPDPDAVIGRGFAAVTDAVSRPVAFRAPYMAADGRVMDAVDRAGIRADSSFYTEVGGCTEPYTIGRITEYPVPKARDSNGKTIAAYLWPMHEGRRAPEDYVHMAEGMDSIVLATHTWHMAETVSGGPMDQGAVRRNADGVRAVIEGILDLGFRAETIGPRRSP